MAKGSLKKRERLCREEEEEEDEGCKKKKEYCVYTRDKNEIHKKEEREDDRKMERHKSRLQ